MSTEKAADSGLKSVMSYLNLSSHYERKARLLPGLLCVMSLLPVGAAFGTPLGDWVGLLATGLGLWAVCGVGLSHLSSAAGNRYQEKLWPRWPFDAPTNTLLHPSDRTSSSQQKKLIHKAVKRLTKLDIEAAIDQGPEEVDAVLNDCVARLRHRLRASDHADRLDIHNADYGFARNFAGLRPIWLSFLWLSASGCWFGFVRHGSSLLWPVAASILAVVGIMVSFGLKKYVRTRARHYTDSFLSAVLELDSAEQKTASGAKTHSKPEKATSPNDLEG